MESDLEYLNRQRLPHRFRKCNQSLIKCSKEVQNGNLLYETFIAHVTVLQIKIYHPLLIVLEIVLKNIVKISLE